MVWGYVDRGTRVAMAGRSFRHKVVDPFTLRLFDWRLFEDEHCDDVLLLLASVDLTQLVLQPIHSVGHASLYSFVDKREQKRVFTCNNLHPLVWAMTSPVDPV